MSFGFHQLMPAIQGFGCVSLTDKVRIDIDLGRQGAADLTEKKASTLRYDGPSNPDHFL